MKTTNEIREILSHPFATEEDRLYWVKKLQEAEQKEETAAENAEYFAKNYKYDRL